ncbi:MAG: VOC family protein [Chloroflexota bacterium]|nr:VOC family protein [Chloroflexota bacterium]
MATGVTETREQSTTTPAATHGVVHVELPAKDAEKLWAFYSGVFGWKFEAMPGMETYKAAMPEGQDGVGFAIYQRDQPDQALTNYISVESISAYAEKIEQHGGKLLHRFSVPGMGHGAITHDPEGNVLGIWQTDPNAKE